MDGNEIADTYEALRNLDNLLTTLLERLPETGGEAAIALELYQSLVSDKRDEFGEAQATRNSFKISDYREQWGNQFPTIPTGELTTTERAFLRTLGVLSPEESVLLPVSLKSGRRLPVVFESKEGLDDAMKILDEFELPTVTTTLLHLSDTHLGFQLRGTHPDAGGDVPPWNDELRPVEAFEEALATAVVRGVDAVVHTGDLFDHNVDRESLDAAVNALNALSEAGIPFFCIMGDHDRDATGGAFPGDVDAITELRILVDQGVVTELSTEPICVGPVALFGVGATNVGLNEIETGRYTLGFWDDPELSFTAPPEQTRSVLCLHERVAPPFSPNENPDCYLDIDFPENSPEFELVAVGHEHAPAREDPWGESTVTYSGPTQRYSSKWPDLSPSVNFIEIPEAGDITISQLSITAGTVSSPT